ncbi:hypothetical protein DCCM_0443 [Desulfocucumis palustris]|uniref:Uncharacterized protein n=1 Tax=Desulfocucumis palustris TaxID=1898651 RepID=A0A2L2X8A3_9FIRM|nr:hypothetical protein DCCM_0443 [Desulfocucumis palustris]
MAGFEGLDWTVIYIPDWKKDLGSDFLKLPKEEQKKQGEYFFLTRDIPKGKKTIHQKSIKQILKKVI